MANFSENFKGQAGTQPCPLCHTALDTQLHSLSCTVLKENISINFKYEEIFFAKVSVETARTVDNILKFREENTEI